MVVFAASGRSVTALYRPTGQQIWQTTLGSVLGPSITMVLAEGDAVFVARGGSVECLDTATGRVRWEADVGPNSITLLATPGQPGSNVAAVRHAAAVAAAVAGGAVAATASAGS